MKERLHYIDVCKGLLILLVIFHHIPYVFWQIAQGPNEVMTDLRDYNFLHASFFMSAFFLVSSFCSNFDKPIRKFAVSNLWSIVIPALLIGTVSQWIKQALVHNYNFTIPLTYYFRQLTHGFEFWFISVLLISRVLYYILHRCKASDIAILAVSVCAIPLGFHLNNINFAHNIWHCNYVLCFFIWFPIGQLLRKHKEWLSKRNLLIAAAIYIVLTIVFIATGTTVPRLKNHFAYPVIDCIPYVLFASTGSLLLIGVAKWIGSNRIFEYFGRQSLAIYILHGSVLHLTITILFRLMAPTSYMGGVGFTIATIVFAAIGCALLTYLISGFKTLFNYLYTYK